MRYTRYEYKKSGNFKFFLAVIIVAVLSIIGGLYISSALFGSKEDAQKTDSVSVISYNESNTNIQPSNIVVLQCGFYSKKENADTLSSSIKQYCYPFTAEENGNYRVIAGIYNEEEAAKKIHQFQEKGIEVSKTTLTLKSDSSDDQKIIEISDGLLKIMSKFEEADVNSIKTSEFKNWCNSILGSSDQCGEKLKMMKNYIQNLPDEITQNNNSEQAYEFYKIIKE